jgi:hypothetical protein
MPLTIRRHGQSVFPYTECELPDPPSHVPLAIFNKDFIARHKTVDATHMLRKRDLDYSISTVTTSGCSDNRKSHALSAKQLRERLLLNYLVFYEADLLRVFRFTGIR